MNRNVLIGAVVVVAVVVGLLIWRALGTSTAKTPVEAPPPVQKPAPAPVPPPPPEPQAAPEPEPSPVPVADPTPAPPPVSSSGVAPTPAYLNQETLTGTKWKDGPMEMELAPNGEWKVAGRTRAKWKVEGKRVKIYDDKGEEHFLDIVGNKLMFEGKEVSRMQ